MDTADGTDDIEINVIHLALMILQAITKLFRE